MLTTHAQYIQHGEQGIALPNPTSQIHSVGKEIIKKNTHIRTVIKGRNPTSKGSAKAKTIQKFHQEGSINVVKGFLLI